MKFIKFRPEYFMFPVILFWLVIDQRGYINKIRLAAMIAIPIIKP